MVAGDQDVSGRDIVLSRIRASLADVPIAEASDGPHRVLDRPASEDPVALFVERVEEYRGSVHRPGASGVAAIVAEIMLGSKTELLFAPGIDGTWLPENFPAVVDGDLTPTQLDGVAGVLTGCAMAIAETGTIVLDGGRLSGRRAITLVPDLHICVVRADQIVASVTEAIYLLRERVREERAPLTFVSGPSATSDIEFQRVEGVHGPRRLEVVLVED